MGPIALFDKSFLQSLTVDESVWFAHYFMPVICPLFYVETLADLDKAVREGRTPEQEVGLIADKFPDSSASPCAHQSGLALGELHGHPIPLDGRIPRSGGRTVQMGDKFGVIFERSMEEAAFSRWQDRKFLDVERGVAHQWRTMLSSINLEDVAKRVRAIGVDATTCRTLEDTYRLAKSVVSGRAKHFERMALLLAVLQIPYQHHRPIIARWSDHNYPSLEAYAPYSAHLLTVELFFEFALAAHKIGSSRSSNRVDIAYLNYLPFCNLFVSGDDLHRRCVPLFLRGDQQFVWGPDLKHDLGHINAHFLANTSESEKDLGITSFARAPPKLDGSIIRKLRADFMGTEYDDRQPVAIPKEDNPRNKELLRQVNEWADAATAAENVTDYENVDTLTIKRSVRKRRGSWYQLPKALTNKSE